MATMHRTPATPWAPACGLATATSPRGLGAVDPPAGVGTATVQIIPPSGVVTAVVNDDNVAAVLSVAAPTVILAGTGSYLLTKGATAGAASLYMSAIPHPGS